MPVFQIVKMGGRSEGGMKLRSGTGVDDDSMTINKKAPTPFINMPYLDIGEDLEFEGGVATPHLNIMFRKV